MLLSQYITDVRDILNDANANFYTDAELTRWINKGREQIAQDAQCIRYIPKNSGVVASYTVTAGGTGYTAATVSVAAPSGMGMTLTTATATATVLAGAVTAVTVVLPGAGYVTPPTVTITGNGTGARATAVLTPFMSANAGQEVYNFSTINGFLASVSGLKSVFGIQTIAVSWGSNKPVLQKWDWSSLQAYARSINIGYQNFPTCWAQYGQGTTGSFYLFPIPSQQNQMDIDCYCMPIDLVDDTSIDLVPSPFDEAVAWWAVYLAYRKSQRTNDSNEAMAQYKQYAISARTVVSPAVVPSFYAEGW